MTRFRTALIATSIAAACASMTAGGGTAAAVTNGDPAVYPHTQKLENGRITISVTNTALAPASCDATFYSPLDKGRVDTLVDVNNRWVKLDGSATYDELRLAMSQLPTKNYGTLSIDHPIAAGATKAGSGNTSGGMTSYYVLMHCGTDITAEWEEDAVASTAFLVNGTSSIPGIGGGAGSLDTGSLGSLFG